MSVLEVQVYDVDGKLVSSSVTPIAKGSKLVKNLYSESVGRVEVKVLDEHPDLPKDPLSSPIFVRGEMDGHPVLVTVERDDGGYEEVS